MVLFASASDDNASTNSRSSIVSVYRSDEEVSVVGERLWELSDATWTHVRR